MQRYGLRDGRSYRGTAERLTPAHNSPPTSTDDVLLVEIPDMPSDNSAGYAEIVFTSVL
jgi:hypothetical protein